MQKSPQEICATWGQTGITTEEINVVITLTKYVTNFSQLKELKGSGLTGEFHIIAANFCFSVLVCIYCIYIYCFEKNIYYLRKKIFLFFHWATACNYRLPTS